MALEGGNLPTTGVVLAAIDEFSANMRRYVQSLDEVGHKTDEAGQQSQRFGRRSGEAGAGAQLGAEKMARYALATGILTGQLQSLGVSAERLTLPLTIVATTMMDGFNVMGGGILVVGALISGVITLATAYSQAEKAFSASASRLVSLTTASGAQNEADRQLLKTLLALDQQLIIKTKADLIAAQASQQHASWMASAAAAGLAYLQTMFGINTATLQGKLLLDSYNASGLNNAKNAADAAVKLHELEQQIKDINTALSGGSDALKKAAEDNANYARWFEDAVWDMQAAVAKSDDKITQRVKDNTAKRKADFLSFVALQTAGFNKTTQAANEAAAKQSAAETAAAQVAVDALKRQMQVAIEVGAVIGDAIGGAIAGTTDVWRSAAVAALGIVKREIETIITLHALITPWLLVKLGAVEAIFSAASAAIMGGSHAPVPVHETGAQYGNASATGGAYGGGYYYGVGGSSAPAGGSVQLVYNDNRVIHGDVSASTRSDLRRDAEEALYSVGPLAARRARALGRNVA